jgi:hypothetical protein
MHRNSSEAGNSAFYNNRQTQLFEGFLPEDTRHNFRIRASYSWRGLTGRIYMQFLSGSPLTKQFFNQQDAGYTTLRAPLGTDPGAGNAASNISEFRACAICINERVQRPTTWVGERRKRGSLPNSSLEHRLHHGRGR